MHLRRLEDVSIARINMRATVHTKHNVCLGRFFLNDSTVVQAADHNANIGICCSDFARLFFSSDQGGIFVIWMSFVDRVEGVASDIASDTCAGKLSVKRYISQHCLQLT